MTETDYLIDLWRCVGAKSKFDRQDAVNRFSMERVVGGTGRAMERVQGDFKWRSSTGKFPRTHDDVDDDDDDDDSINKSHKLLVRSTETRYLHGMNLVDVWLLTTSFVICSLASCRFYPTGTEVLICWSLVWAINRGQSNITSTNDN